VDSLDWTGATAVIVGGGPSAATAHLELAVGRAKVIAVNSSWRLAPWADVLFACDAAWWFHHKGVPEFPGHKYTASPTAARRFGLQLFTSLGSNSGFRAMRLADQFGAGSILLVGFDMHVTGGVHWHEPHQGVLKNPTTNSMALWRAEIERSVRKFKATITNCTPGSALKCFPYLPLEEALNHGSDGQDRSDRPRHLAVHQ
jgi:hypothetical protein